MMTEETIMQVQASAPRRFLGVVMLVLLGAVLIWLGLRVGPVGLGWRLLLIGLGVAILIMAEAMRRATRLIILLTARDLRDSDGTIIAPLDEMVGLARGAFAVRPSQGFSLTLKQAHGLGWRPGMWWRFGRRVGVGGVIARHQTKLLAEVIAARLAERDG